MIHEGQLFPVTYRKPDFIIPENTKTVADNDDFLCMFDSEGAPYKITKANFLSGAGAINRSTQVFNINNAIAKNANYTTSFSVAKAYQLFTFKCLVPIRVRIYNSQANQQADLTRSATTLPSNNSGLIFEGITSLSNPTINLSPVAIGYSLDNTETSYITVTNLSESDFTSLTFDLSYLPTEGSNN